MWVLGSLTRTQRLLTTKPCLDPLSKKVLYCALQIFRWMPRLFLGCWDPDCSLHDRKVSALNCWALSSTPCILLFELWTFSFYTVIDLSISFFILLWNVFLLEYAYFLSVTFLKDDGDLKDLKSLVSKHSPEMLLSPSPGQWEPRVVAMLLVFSFSS